MTYSILVPDLNERLIDDGVGESWFNLTLNIVLSNDDLFVDAGRCENYELEGDSVSEQAEYLREYTELSYNLEHYLQPSYNYVHVLQSSTIYDEDLIKLYKNASNLVVIQDGQGNNYLALTTCGMGLGDTLAYGYMVIDRCIPPDLQRSPQLTLNDDAYQELTDYIGGLKTNANINL